VREGGGRAQRRESSLSRMKRTVACKGGQWDPSKPELYKERLNGKCCSKRNWDGGKEKGGIRERR